MVTILETPAIRRLVKPFSVATYEQMGEQVFGRPTELIRGAILEKMSISPLHAFLVTKLRQLILVVVGPTAYCREQIPLKLADSMPETRSGGCGRPGRGLYPHPSDHRPAGR